MKFVIDIPDDVYERIKSTKTIETTDYDIVSLYRAVKLGKEQPQGEWIDTASGYKCSVCGESNDYAYDEYKHKFTDYYCPNCGAKMKLG